MSEMLGFVFRALWRILVGIITLFLAFLSAYFLFPYLDNHLPTLVAFIVFYLLAAYIGIPFLVRLWRLVIKPNHLPIYAHTRDGWSSDPVNVAVICESGEQLIEVMEKAGWHQADRNGFKTTPRFAWAMLFNKSYPTAPFSSLFLFGRPQDLGFQIQTGSHPSPRHRHHVRFWQLDTASPDRHAHYNFWENIFELFTRKKRQIWIGAATHDVKPFAFRAQNLQVTHGIDPDTNRERDYVVQTLEDSKQVRYTETITTGEPLQFRGQSFGVRIVVDGKLKVVELKKPATHR